MVRLGEFTSWREDYLRSAAKFEAHMEECTRQRAEDIRLAAERHSENQRRLDVQDRMQEKLARDLNGLSDAMSKQLIRMIWTVGSGMAAVGLSLVGFILQHAFK